MVLRSASCVLVVLLLSPCALAQRVQTQMVWYALAHAMRDVLEVAGSQGVRPEHIQIETCPHYDHFEVELQASVPLWKLAAHLKMASGVPEVRTEGASKRIRFVVARAIEPSFGVGPRYGMPDDWQALVGFPGAENGRLTLPPRQADRNLPMLGPFDFDLEAPTSVALAVLDRASDRIGYHLTSALLSEPETPHTRLRLGGAASRVPCPGPVPSPDASSTQGADPGSQPSEPTRSSESWIGF